MKPWIRALSIFLTAAVPLAQATVHDHLFKGSFDIPADAPASSNDAARFLTQATFGPTSADINYLMAQGVGEWIDEQLAKPTTLAEPTVEAVFNARTNGGQGVNQTQRLNRLYWQAVYAPDQLRQRMAYALSQIFVVSDQSSAINQDVVPMTHYWDLLAGDAFGYYGILLSDVTYNPTMGKYLNAFHNTRSFCSGGNCTSPDENYAREVMQLFSIGLILLNMDHSPVLNGGQTIPTYDQTVITHTAKVFTGFTYSDAPTNPPNFNFGGVTFAGQYNPMACWGTELFPASSNNMKHDITGDDGTTNTPKTVLGGATIPANQTCAQDVADEIAIIASHQNVAPFISRQLIQRFVSSNPSPAYIQRVASVFDTPGNDLGDVIKAILTDSEARNPPALPTPGVGACPSGGNCDSYGKLREPVLRLTAMWRAFNAQAPAPDAYGEIAMIGSGVFQGALGQNFLESPTVFNFYLPDYQLPGVFADNNLYSPEFQITNASSTYTTANLYDSFIAKAYQGMTNPPTNRPLIDLSSLTANVGNPSAMVATINANMLYGTMSPSMSARLTTMLTSLASANASAQEQAWSLIYVTMLSPEYATQR